MSGDLSSDLSSEVPRPLIDKIYVIISKEKEPDRYEYLMAFVEKYPALGAIMEVSEPYWYGRDTGAIDLSRFDRGKLKESECMLFESHLKVLRTAIDCNVGRFLLLESDCIFAEKFDKLLTCICQQWIAADISNSIVFLGNGGGIPIRAENTAITENLCRATSTRCTDSILMTRHSAEILYRNSVGCPVDLPIDHFWNNIIRRGDVTSMWIKPHIIIQGSQINKYNSHLR